MSDSDLKKSNVSQIKSTGPADLKNQVADAGAELKQRAEDALKVSADVAQDKLKDAASAAKEVASGAADHLQEQVHEKQRSGADFVERFAGNIRDAARAFESDAPFAARGISSAAEYVEDAAGKIRNGSFRDLVDGATDFAKRQPAAFLGNLGPRRLCGDPLSESIRRSTIFLNSKHRLEARYIVPPRQSVMTIPSDIKTSKDDVRTISILLGDALSQFAKLFQNEVDLAKAELDEKAQQVFGAIAFIGGGAILVIPALVMVLFALSAALMAAGWSQALSYLASAILAALIAGALFAIGINRLDARNLAREKRCASLKRTRIQ